jgi:hypothetical protein
LWTQKLKKKKKLRRVKTRHPTSEYYVRVSTVPENAKQLFKSGGSFKIYEDQ